MSADVKEKNEPMDINLFLTVVVVAGCLIVILQNYGLAALLSIGAICYLLLTKFIKMSDANGEYEAQLHKLDKKVGLLIKEGDAQAQGLQEEIDNLTDQLEQATELRVKQEQEVRQLVESHQQEVQRLADAQQQKIAQLTGELQKSKALVEDYRAKEVKAALSLASGKHLWKGIKWQ